MSAMLRPPKTSIATEFDRIRADYEMSRVSRFVRRRTGLAPQGGSADYHYRSESLYYQDIEKARDMDRNDAIVGQTIDRAVANEVQDGFSLDPQTGDKSLNDELWALWQEWANDPDACDLAGEHTWHDFEQHASRSQKLDGDCVLLGIDNGALQFIESHGVQTTTQQPNTFLGVQLGEFGRHDAYWIMQEPKTPLGQKEQAVPVSVRNDDGFRQAFHVYNPKRMSQTRGVTSLAPIFSLAGMFEDIQFAKLVQQQVVSCFAIFRQQAQLTGGELPRMNGSYGAPQIEVTQAGTRYLENIAPGMEIIGAPGETLTGFSPDVPNAEYFTHVKLMLQMIGVNLGLPLCLVLMDGSETNFSGWRGAVDEARKGWRSNQTNLVNRLHKPVYRWKVAQWISTVPSIGRAYDRLGDVIFAHKWNAPRWQYIDPVGDAQGDQLRLQNGLISPRRLHAERGAEWEEIADEIVADMSYAIISAKKLAQQINKDQPDAQPVQWRELINLPMPQGVTMAVGDPNTTTAAEGVNTATPDIQATALNGAQVDSLLSIIEQITTGILPPDAAKAVIQSAFPLITSEQVAAIVDPILVAEANQQSGTAEMAGLSTLQWNRNVKAIEKTLTALASGEMSEEKARVFLSSIGMSSENVEKLIADAIDGKVDTDMQEMPVA